MLLYSITIIILTKEYKMSYTPLFRNPAFPNWMDFDAFDKYIYSNEPVTKTRVSRSGNA